MKIGLRTVKTAISAALIIAEKLGLLYAPSAGLFQFMLLARKTSVMTGLSFVILSFSNYFSVYLFYFLVLQRLLLVFFYYLFQQPCIFNYLMGLL